MSSSDDDDGYDSDQRAKERAERKKRKEALKKMTPKEKLEAAKKRVAEKERKSKMKNSFKNMEEMAASSSSSEEVVDTRPVLRAGVKVYFYDPSSVVGKDSARYAIVSEVLPPEKRYNDAPIVLSSQHVLFMDHYIQVVEPEDQKMEKPMMLKELNLVTSKVSVHSFADDVKVGYKKQIRGMKKKIGSTGLTDLMAGQGDDDGAGDSSSSSSDEEMPAARRLIEDSDSSDEEQARQKRDERLRQLQDEMSNQIEGKKSEECMIGDCVWALDKSKIRSKAISTFFPFAACIVDYELDTSTYLLFKFGERKEATRFVRVSGEHASFRKVTCARKRPIVPTYEHMLDVRMQEILKERDDLSEEDEIEDNDNLDPREYFKTRWKGKKKEMEHKFKRKVQDEFEAGLQAIQDNPSHYRKWLEKCEVWKNSDMEEMKKRDSMRSNSKKSKPASQLSQGTRSRPSRIAQAAAPAPAPARTGNGFYITSSDEDKPEPTRSLAPVAVRRRSPSPELSMPSSRSRSPIIVERLTKKKSPKKSPKTAKSVVKAKTAKLSPLQRETKAVIEKQRKKPIKPRKRRETSSSDTTSDEDKILPITTTTKRTPRKSPGVTPKNQKPSAKKASAKKKGKTKSVARTPTPEPTQDIFDGENMLDPYSFHPHSPASSAKSTPAKPAKKNKSSTKKKGKLNVVTTAAKKRERVHDDREDSDDLSPIKSKSYRSSTSKKKKSNTGKAVTVRTSPRRA